MSGINLSISCTFLDSKILGLLDKNKKNQPPENRKIEKPKLEFIKLRLMAKFKKDIKTNNHTILFSLILTTSN
ncbi:hypothetical protein [Pseudoalteromonas luteoviolacea]|uniref:hypothetical protein n=1 Tax=Pseudoalteromonas luteoviolacea TaxID=43657 RepID=UPI0012DA4507|nr:hypothetical protein [Pseudoalteromonas luteoviolacea]